MINSYNQSEKINHQPVAVDYAKEELELKIQRDKEIDYFQLFFTEDFLEEICQECNDYITKKYIKRYGSDFKNQEFPINSSPELYIKNGIQVRDLKAFLCVQLLMSIVRIRDIDDYWSDSWVFQTAVPKIMSMNYFKLISNALNLPMKFEKVETEFFKLDHRKKVISFCSKLRSLFIKYAILEQNLILGEGLVFHKRRSYTGYYLPLNLHRTNFVMHMLVESKTNYVYNFMFDPDNQGHKSKSKSFTELNLVKLLNGLENKGYIVNLDRKYSAKSMCLRLKEQGFGIHTSVNEKDLKTRIKNKHSTGKYSCKLWKQVWMFGIEAAISNAIVIKERKNGPIDHFKFRTNLLHQLLEGYCDLGSNKENSADDFSEESLDMHSIIDTEENEEKCFICKGLTTMRCEDCDIPLHHECFDEYHSEYVYDSN
jgi:hypothetical protein